MGKHTQGGARGGGGNGKAVDAKKAGRSAVSQSAVSPKTVDRGKMSARALSSAVAPARGRAAATEPAKPAARGGSTRVERSAAAGGAATPAERRPGTARRGGPEIARRDRHGPVVPAPEGRPIRSPLRQAFLDRVSDLAVRMADGAPEDLLAAALAEATPIGTVATAMSAFVVEERALDAQDRVLAAARARGARAAAELLTRAGGAYTAEQLAEVLGKAGGRQTIAAGRASNRYFGLPTTAGYAYPRLQLTEAGTPLAGLREFLDAVALPDPWMKLVLLLDPAPQLEGGTPLAALRRGDVDGAIAVARAYGSHGA